MTVSSNCSVLDFQQCKEGFWDGALFQGLRELDESYLLGHKQGLRKRLGKRVSPEVLSADPQSYAVFMQGVHLEPRELPEVVKRDLTRINLNLPLAVILDHFENSCSQLSEERLYLGGLDVGLDQVGISRTSPIIVRHPLALVTFNLALVGGGSYPNYTYTETLADILCQEAYQLVVSNDRVRKVL